MNPSRRVRDERRSTLCTAMERRRQGQRLRRRAVSLLIPVALLMLVALVVLYRR